MVLAAGTDKRQERDRRLPPFRYNHSSSSPCSKSRTLTASVGRGARANFSRRSGVLEPRQLQQGSLTSSQLTQSPSRIVHTSARWGCRNTARVVRAQYGSHLSAQARSGMESQTALGGKCSDNLQDCDDEDKKSAPPASHCARVFLSALGNCCRELSLVWPLSCPKMGGNAGPKFGVRRPLTHSSPVKGRRPREGEGPQPPRGQ